MRIAEEGETQGHSKKANVANSGGGDNPGDFSLISTACFRASERGMFYLDSGCTQHMSDERGFFINYRDIRSNSRPVDGIGGTKLFAHGIGDIEVTRSIDGKIQTGRITDVLFVPKLTVNLISIACITELGFEVTFKNNTAQVRRGSEVVMIGTRVGKTLYQLDISASTNADRCLIASSSNANLQVWHQRLAHIDIHVVKKMATSDHIDGMMTTPENGILKNGCHGCNMGKMHKLPFTSSTSKTRVAGELIHSDVVGPMQVSSPNGARYYIVFKDDYTRYKVVYFLKHKSESAECFKNYTKIVTRDTGKRVKLLRSDNGGEYIGKEFEEWLLNNGIKHQTSAPHTAEQNGKAERDHRTTVEAARSHIHAKRLPLKLWAEAINYSVYALNRTLTTRHDITPFELWHGKKPNISHMRIFGSPAYVFIPDAERQKLDPKAEKGIYVGECENQKASRIYIEDTGRTIISRHIKVYEQPNEPTIADSDDMKIDSDSAADEEQSDPENVETDNTLRTRKVTFGPMPTRQSMRGRIPKKLHPMETYAGLSKTSDITSLAFHAHTLIFYEPKSFKEAMASEESELWKLAADDEIRSHHKNNTWTIVPLPEGRTCIPSGWNFKIKTGKDGLPKRRKARFFAKGYKQIKGIDFEESFAPVVRYDSLRVMFAIAAAHDLELFQLDVKTTFLNGEVDEELYIAQPEGYVVAGREKEVCRLNKSIYGIRQASRIWNMTLHSALLAFGLTQSTADPCIYSRIRGDEIIIIAIWVDDGLIAGSNISLIRNIIRYLNTNFEIEHGPAEHFVGIVIERDRPGRKIYLSAPHYIEKMLAKFNMTSVHPVAIPADKGGPHLSKSLSPTSRGESDLMKTLPYREAVGGLLYAAITLRPDIAFVTSRLAQYCENPGVQHWKAAKRVIKYLAGPRDYGICFGGSETFNRQLNGYSDADYAADIDTRRSTSGFVFTLNGGPVSWTSRRQPIVALSTMESEYIAASDASREATWLRILLKELGIEQNKPTPIWCDNESAISLAKNPNSHKRFKHIDVRYHYIREQVMKKVVNMSYINTKSQLADILTKALDVMSQKKLMKEIGIVKIHHESE